MRFIKDKRVRRRSIFCVSLLLGLTAVFFLVPESQRTDALLQAPSLAHPFGTDQLGRDMLVRSVHGFVYSFFIAFIINAVSFCLGNLLGVMIGYYGGWADRLYAYLLNLFMSIPMMIVFLTVLSMLGRGLLPIFCVLIFTVTLFRIRMAKNETVVMKNSDYILNLRILGAKDGQIILHHLLPHVWKLTFPLFAMLLGHIIISVSGLSFLGFGVQPPKADIGVLMKDALRFTQRAPWLMIFPGLFQVTIILIFNRWGEAIARVTDLRKRKGGIR